MVSTTVLTLPASLMIRIFFFKLFLFPGLRNVPLSSPRFLLYIQNFGRMPGIEHELLRPQPGVLPMSYTHPFSVPLTALIYECIRK